MLIRPAPVTLAAFSAFIAQPEHADRLFELINGEIIDVSPGRTLYSEISHIIVAAVRWFCRERGLPCHTSGGDGAYRVGDHVVAPDFAYKRTRMSSEYPDPVPPEWVAEVILPTDRAADIRAKRQIYLDAGILLWEVYPPLLRVDVYEPGKPVRQLEIEDTLDGGTVLPEFRLIVKALFAE